MKITIHVPTEVEVDSVRLLVPFRYDDEDEDAPYDFPLRVKDMWDVTIDLDSGVIRGWPSDAGAQELHMKVCDMGHYYLLSGDKQVAAIEQDYVPGFMPGDHYGDYIILNIGADGKIAKWGNKCNLQRVTTSFFGDKE